MSRLLLALDYGGTKLTAAVLRAGEEGWAAHARRAVEPGADAGRCHADMLEMARELLARIPGRPLAIGVSFGGPVDARRGLIRLSHHVPGWEEVPLRDRLQKEFDLPAAVDNDANAAALGEWRFGAGRGCESLLYVTVSTGIGGGWVLAGRPWSGADGMAGEIGHIVLRPQGRPCSCGRRGCLEAEACGTAIGLKARDRMAGDAAAGPILRQLARHQLEAVTCELVARAAAEGDVASRQVLEDAAQALGAGLGGAINMVNPELVLLGGGVTKSGARWWQVVRETARRHALSHARVDIRAAALGDDAPLRGAAALAENTGAA